MLRTRAPLTIASAFDLHVLGPPQTFALSQDQTLQFELCSHHDRTRTLACLSSDRLSVSLPLGRDPTGCRPSGLRSHKRRYGFPLPLSSFQGASPREDSRHSPASWPALPGAAPSRRPLRGEGRRVVLAAPGRVKTIFSENSPQPYFRTRTPPTTVLAGKMIPSRTPPRPPDTCSSRRFQHDLGPQGDLLARLEAQVRRKIGSQLTDFRAPTGPLRAVGPAAWDAPASPRRGHDAPWPRSARSPRRRPA